MFSILWWNCFDRAPTFPWGPPGAVRVSRGTSFWKYVENMQQKITWFCTYEGIIKHHQNAAGHAVFQLIFRFPISKKLWLKKKKGEPALDWGSGTGSGWPPAGRKPWFWLKYIISLSFHKIIPDHHEREHVEADVVVPLARVQVTSGWEKVCKWEKN